MRKLAVVALLAIVVCLDSPPVDAKGAKPTCQASTIGQCPAAGCGGDPLLNQLKNNEDLAENPQEIDLEDIIAKKQPRKWASGQDLSSLSDLGEGDPVVEAFVIHAKAAEPETCNCNLKGQSANDFHTNLVNASNLSVDDSVVAEITPHIQRKGWTLSKLQMIAGESAYVRVSGYLLFDSQHVSVSGGPRATLWEIHPITAFEVCPGTVAQCKQGERWEPLEDF